LPVLGTAGKITDEAITLALEKGQLKQVEVINVCKEMGVNKRAVQTVLKRYSNGKDRLWEVERGFQHNTLFYRLPESTPGVQSENRENSDNRDK